MSEYLSTDPNAGLDYLSTDPNAGLDVEDERKRRKDRNWMRAVGDLGASFIQGAVDVNRAVANVGGADNIVSEKLGDLSKGIDKNLRSDFARDRRQEHQRLAEEASGIGMGAEAWQAVKNFADAPLDYTAQGLGSVAGLYPAMKTAGITAARAGLGAIGTKIATGAAVGVPVGVGATKGAQYEESLQYLLKHGVPEARAKEIAVRAQKYGLDNALQHAIGGGLGVVDVLTGGEAAMMSRDSIRRAIAGRARHIARRGAEEFGAEALQGGHEKLAGNLAAIDVGDTERKPMRGVVGAGVQEGLMGLGPGSIMGALERTRTQDATPPVQPPTAPAGTPPVQPAPTDDALDAADLVADESVQPAPAWTAPAQPTTMQAPSMDAPVSIVPTNHFGTPLSMGDPVSIIPTATIAQRRDEATSPEDRLAIEQEMQRRGLPGASDGATDQGGQVSPVAAQGAQGAGADVPGSGSDPQTGVPGGLAGGSGSATVSGSTDGSAVPAGNESASSVTTPATPAAPAGVFDPKGLKPGTDEYNVAYEKWTDEQSAARDSENKKRQRAENKAAADKKNGWRQKVLDWFAAASDGDAITTDIEGEEYRVIEKEITRNGKTIKSKRLVAVGAFGEGRDMGIAEMRDGSIHTAPRTDIGIDEDTGSIQPETDTDSRASALGKLIEDGVAKFVQAQPTGEPIAPKPSQPAQKESQAKSKEGKTVEVTQPANAKTDEGSIFDQRFPSIAAAEKVIKDRKLKQVAVFKDGDQYRIGAKGKTTKSASNNLLQRIKQLGGINEDLIADITGEKSKKGMQPGLFRKREVGKGGTRAGLGLDDLASVLAGEGFPINMEDATDNGGVNQLSELIREAIGGRTIYNHDGLQEAMRKEADANYRENLRDDIIGMSGTEPAKNASIKQLEAMRDKLRAKFDQQAIADAATLDAIIGKDLTDADWELLISERDAAQFSYDQDIDAIRAYEQEMEASRATEAEYERSNQESARQAPARGPGEDNPVGRAEPYNQGAQKGGAEETGLTLTGQTPEEVKAAEKAQEAAKKKADAEAKAAEDAAREKRIAKEIADRQQASAENFVLGQSAEDAIAGQGDIFSQSAAKKEEAPASKPAKEPWQMTSAEFAQNQLDNNKYKAAYEEDPELKASFMKDQQRAWVDTLLERAKEGRIPDNVLDDFVEKFGVDGMMREFRGIHEKGVSGYATKAVRDTPVRPDVVLEPWQKDAHERTWAQQREIVGQGLPAKLKTPAFWKKEKEAHKAAIQKAIWDGKKIANEVLVDYQDLAAKVAGEPAKLGLFKDGIEGTEVPFDSVPNGNDSFQYAKGRTTEDGEIAVFRRKASERGSYGGWRWEADVAKVATEAKPAKPTPEAAQEKAKIEDFGEKLPPARRAMAAKLNEDLTDEAIESQPLSKIWPLKENEAIEDTFAAAVASVMRENIPAKPRKGYKLNSWVAKVKMLRDLAAKVVDGRVSKDRFNAELGKYSSLKSLGSKIKLLEQIDRAQWGRIGDVSEAPDALRYVDGNPIRVPQAFVKIDDKQHWLQESGDINDHVETIKALLAGDAPDVRMQFEIRQERTGNKKVFINKKGDKEYRRLMEFDTVAEARKAMKDQYDDLVAAWDGVKGRDNINERDLRAEENRPRAGKDHRKGKDISAEEFQGAFGFKGGEFGKWVSQGKNAQERQFFMNSAYDAFMDLADILGIPPKAISLEGTLGIAFGSRGSGWASAHFEPSNLVINLTKPRGAGALAHEWFHAMDNYFARKRGGEVPMTPLGGQDEYRNNNFITHKTTPMMVRKDGKGSPVTRERLAEWRKSNPTSGYLTASEWIADPNHKEGVRAEVEERFENLVNVLNQSPMLNRSKKLERSGDYWSRTLERAARSFENYIMTRMMEQGYHNDFLANVKDAETVGKSNDRYPYLLPEEIAPVAEAFDNLFNTIQTKETGQGMAMFEPAAVYTVSEDGPTYDTDLFGNPLPDQNRKRDKAADRGVIRAATSISSEPGNIPGTYQVRTALVTEQDRTIGVNRVRTPEDAARALGYLSNKAVEHFDALVTDKNGKPLAIIGAFKGTISATSVYPQTLVAEAIRIPGAAEIWMAHNHPSGTHEPSMADRNLTEQVKQVFIGTGIEVVESLVIAGPADRRLASGIMNGMRGEPVKKPDSSIKVPVVELSITEDQDNRAAVSSPAVAKGVYAATKESGVLFLDSQNKVAGFYPIQNWDSLLTDGRLAELYRAMSMANASGAMIFDKGALPDNKIRNVANALARVDVRMLDVLHDAWGGVASWTEKGKAINDGSAVFSRNTTVAGIAMRDLKAVVARVKRNMSNLPNVQVMTSPEALDRENPSQAKLYDFIQSAGAMDDVEGATHDGEIYLFASGLVDEARAEHVLATHEITHYGLRAVFGADLDQVLQTIWATNAVVSKRAAALRKKLDLNSNVSAAEEVLADMTPAELVKLKGWRKLVGVVRDWLRSHGFTALAGKLDGWMKAGMTEQQQADMLVADVVNAARDWVKGGKQAAKVAGGTALADANLSRSAMKSVAANIDRGLKALSDAIVGKKSVHRAMFRNGMGWIDFIWGDTGRILESGRSKGASGLSHIVEARMRKDGLTEDQAIGVLNELVRTVAAGQEFKRDVVGKSTRVGIRHDGYIAWLMKLEGGNAWIVTGYEENPDGATAGRATDAPTDTAASLTRDGTVAGSGSSITKLSRASQANNRQALIPGINSQTPPAPSNQATLGLQGGATINSSVWNRPEPSKMDDIIFKLQDKHIDLKRAVQGITEAGRQIADKWNAYMQEELFHGRSAKRVRDFADRELAPMLRDMVIRKVSIADLDQYLWARHAKEANALIEQRDPGVMVDDVTGEPKGSGMTDQEADDYFASLSADQRNQLAAIARQVDSMIARTRDLYVSYGLESRDTVQGWADMFQHYVPLMREDHDGGMGVGQGFSIKGREARHRTGSTRAVADVLANIAMQREKAIVRGEKNRVAVSLAGLVKLNPAPDFWSLDKIPTERVLNEKTGMVETREVPGYRNRDNVIIAKIKDSNGNVRERVIVMNEDNPRAVRLAKTMKNIDIPMLEGWLGAAAVVTRYFSAINTQYNPVFGFINLIRDVGAGALNLSSTALKGKEAVVTNPKRIASAVAGIYSDARKERKGQIGTSPWAQLWEDFTEQGGQTGYRDMYRTSNDRADAMQMVMDPTSWTEGKWGQFFTAKGTLKVPLLTVQKAATPLFQWLSDFNLAMENAVRLSAYKEALDSGMSKPQAASLAKNLTVNFNRKGAWGAQAGALYAFFNAATQGTARIGETLTRRDPATGKYSVSGIGKKIIGGGVMLGVMQAVALAMAGFDDDEPPEFIRERNFVIPLMDGKYVSIPMPLGFHVIPNIGRIATETLMGRRGSATEAAIDLMGITFDAFNPMGSAGWSMQTVVPTILDPMAAIIENKDWTGKPIAREKFSNSDPTPGFDMAKDNASAISTGIAYAINMATGGTDYTAGRVSPTPDQLDYLWGQVTGGVGREFNKLYQTIESQFTGEELPPHKIPLAGRLYGNTQSKSAISSRFYENVRDMKKHKAEYMGRMEDGDKDGAKQYLEDNPDATMMRAVTEYESKLQQLRSLKRKTDDPERVKAIEERISELMNRFNERIDSAKQ